jgi:hypothetical protein
MNRDRPVAYQGFFAYAAAVYAVGLLASGLLYRMTAQHGVTENP